MAKIRLIEIGMDDPMERLYYERQEHRKKAYAARQRRLLTNSRKRTVTACQMGRYRFSQVSSASI